MEQSKEKSGDCFCHICQKVKLKGKEMKNSSESLMVLVTGPYRSGTSDNPVLIASNLAAMNRVALQLFRAGHLPVLGEWSALPLIQTAGSNNRGDTIFNEIFHPISEMLVRRCDACLRIGGPSAGADAMVELARSYGQPIFYSVEELAGAAV